MTYILVSLTIIIFIIYYLEKFQSAKVLKEKKIVEPVVQKTLEISPEDVKNIYTEKKGSLAQELHDIENMRIPQQLIDFHLINEGECEQTDLDLIFEIVKSIPQPHSMLRAITKGEIEQTEQLFQLVKKDPEIANKILEAVNSSGFYLTQKITQLNHAILYLGGNTVKNIALQCIIRTPPSKEDPRLTYAFNKIWSTAFLASSLTFLFAKNLELRNASELATQTLLAYIGNLAILSYKPHLAYCFSESLSLFERVQVEQKELRLNSALVGAELASIWKLSQPIIDSIKNNLIPLNVPPALCTLPVDFLHDIVLNYSCCRIAEEVINKGILDIGEVNLLNTEQMELFYLNEYINKTELNSLLFLQKKPAFRREANKLIEKIAAFHTKEAKKSS